MRQIAVLLHGESGLVEDQELVQIPAYHHSPAYPEFQEGSIVGTMGVGDKRGGRCRGGLAEVYAIDGSRTRKPTAHVVGVNFAVDDGVS
jgi:hypothetical protein